jgi:hypothetical protein
MRVAVRGLIVAGVSVALTAVYLLLIAPHFLDPDSMAAPLVFVALPLWLIHALLLATLCGSLVCATRALYIEHSSRTAAGYSVFAGSLALTALLAYLYVYHHVLGR